MIRVVAELATNEKVLRVQMSPGPVGFAVKVAEAAPARIDHGDLTALLYIQGYRKAEFVDQQ